MTVVAAPRLPGRQAMLAPTLVFLVVSLAGRYSFERAGVDGLDLVELRTVGIGVGFALVAFALSRHEHDVRSERRGEGWLVLAGLFFLYQIGSGLWAPQSARVGEKSLDVALLALLTLGVYLAAKDNPATAARLAFGFFFVAAVIFAVGALVVTGPGAQGRYAAFGGGPNVFVRIEILGIISAVALYRLTGRLAVLAAAPFLLGAAVLSGSRGGLLAGLIIGAVALVRARGRVAAAPALVVGAASIVAGALVWVTAPPAVSALVQNRFVQQTGEQLYLSGRTDIWSDTAQLAGAHPVLGAGLDGFYGLIGRTTGIEYPHNYLLAVAAEGGAIGLGLLAAAVLLWTMTVWRGRAYRVETLLAATAAAFVAVDSLFSGDYYDARLAFLFAALAAAAATARPEQAFRGAAEQAAVRSRGAAEPAAVRSGKPPR